ncbi:MAG TPA: urease accessory UreF family protein [Stellaceae bacterium]|nr:urease accessory UreF family protein [Stellaceae bacterium]
MTTEALYRLLAWASPTFPTGAFSYSHGLEAAFDDGAVRDRATLERWIAAIVSQGSGRIDADLLRDAWRAAAAGVEAALAEANRRGIAYRATGELALESGQQGAAFRAAYAAAWDPHPPTPAAWVPPSPASGRGASNVGGKSPLPLAGEGGSGHSPETGEGACHAVAFGAAAARGGVALADALTAYLSAFAANLMSAGLRLGIIGQTDGQRILAALEPVVAAAVAASLGRDAEDFGAATFAVDLMSMAHETQYSRLFRS